MDQFSATSPKSLRTRRNANPLDPHFHIHHPHTRYRNHQSSDQNYTDYSYDTSSSSSSCLCQNLTLIQQDFNSTWPPSPSIAATTTKTNDNDEIYDFNNLSFDLDVLMQPASQADNWIFGFERNSGDHYLIPCHNRNSSASSIGSTDPPSPYPSVYENPQILLSTGDNNIYYDSLDYDPFHPSYNNTSNLGALLPDPVYDYNNCSSVYSPQFPDYHQLVAMQKQQSVQHDTMSAPATSESAPPLITRSSEKDVPKLDRTISSSSYREHRTMSDVYNDELYSPNFAYTSAPAKPTNKSTAPPKDDVFSQRLQAANNQHLSASTTSAPLNVVRGTSPFRQGSPLAPTSDAFAPNMRMASAQQIREKQKAENDAIVLAQQIKRSSPQVQTTQDKTISPKDVELEYKEDEDATAAPLFPPLSQPGYRAINVPQIKAEPSSASDVEESSSQQSFRSMATTRRESSSASSSTAQQSGVAFAPPSVPGTVQVPQQYPFVPRARREPSNISATPDFPSTLTSMESSSSDYIPDAQASIMKKPPGTTADSGTYTCTYHGCTQRFDTPAKLQKHKREGHRQSQPVQPRIPSGTPESDDEQVDTSAPANRNSQAGPHKCERINPSTGKPCNTVFSRPYDLTRHEDTIHNARKQKVRCQICTEEKTFSRNDALTRHMRVVHPEVIEFQPKKKR